MVEGGGSKDFQTIKRMLYGNPQLLQRLLMLNRQAVVQHLNRQIEAGAQAVMVFDTWGQRLLMLNRQAVVQHLNRQIEAGAQAVMVFDTWGGVLSTHAYQAFSLQHITYIMQHLHRQYAGQRIPAIVFTKGGGQWLTQMAHCGADALGLDWTTDLGAARQQVGAKVALQGNLDPAILLAPQARIQDEVARTLSAFGVPQAGSGYVFNLGHGVAKETPPEAVTALVEAVHQFQFADRPGA